MGPPDDHPPSVPADRLVHIEELVTHFERLIAELNEALTAQERRLSHLEHIVARMSDEIGMFSARLEPRRQPEDDRPPHY